MTALADPVGQSVSDCPTVRRCVAVAPEVFAAEHWGRRPLVSPAAELPRPFDDLLTLADVDELLSRRGLRTPFLRVARNGDVISSDQFTRGGGVGAEVADQVGDDQVARLFDQGCTLVLQGLHRLWPPLIELAGRLSSELGHPAQINAYITPPSSQGFAAHFDVHDVFVLQVAGQKRWRVHEPVHEDPLRSHHWDKYRDQVAERAGESPVIDRVLSPGDALYLPRGYLHSAKALGEVSAHLTVGVHVLTRYALVEALLGLAGAERDLRTTLPLGIDAADPDQIAPHLAETVEVLARVLGEIAPGEVARRVRDRVWSGSRPQPLAPIAQAAAASSVRVGDGVRLREGVRFRLGFEGESVVLELPGNQLTLPASTGPALATLLAGASCVIGELPGLPGADQVVLVRRLLREGVLVPACGS
ncbi:cupin domain-containing protein [Actinokineospora enzanensis]|uniref:cupin domain-containing protein n=1 Tax=Actinokineospora enzanensis TaxID=155975 RepID=UPI000362A011|nr:cupin domain-containing protein [Actinokineospora enzanensis]